MGNNFSNQQFLKNKLSSKYQKIYKGNASEVAFPLGGIGTGNFSIGSRGQLKDWEIFNRPGKNNSLPYTFFSIRINQNKKTTAKVLESKINPPYNLRFQGSRFFEVSGLPRFSNSILKGEYPFVKIKFLDEEIPLKVSMEAFTPLIPLNADDSGIPAAIIRYTVKNTTNRMVNVAIAGTLANVVGSDGCNFDKMNENKNKYRSENELRGLYYTSPKTPREYLYFGNMSFVTSDKDITYKCQWDNTGWFDGIQDFWGDFCEDGKLRDKSNKNGKLSGLGIVTKTKYKIGSICINKDILPNEEKVFEFIIAWWFPNRIKGWYGWIGWDKWPKNYDNYNEIESVKNYYSKRFKDSWHAARYLKVNLKKLEKLSRDFQSSLFNTTLPNYVIEAVANNIAVIRSNTCFRIEDGTFLAWEGCTDSEGCCPGNCTHVWNYAQTLAFLFPELEQTMRKVEFNLGTDNKGKMSFRSCEVFGKEKWDFEPSVDGQMGTIVRLYRDWKISGNNELITQMWDKIYKSLDFAFVYWDKDKDFVLDGRQHTTYDIEFYGPNSLSNSLFFAALKAGIEMAEFMGDKRHVRKYKEAFKKGNKNLDKLCWNGEYYIQYLPGIENYRYQYGEGCLSDQLFGQTLAHLVGLGYVLPRDHVRKAINSVFKYNFKNNLKDHNNIYRAFAINDEKALVVCSWPKGGKPKFPFPYSEENFTGIEYQVATHLIYEGFVNEGLTIVKAIRERFDGYRRNPWNEVECGNHYVRSLASWGLLIALSGFKYDMRKRAISFSPKINEDKFSTFWSTGKGWGTYHQIKDIKTKKLKWNIEVLYGSLEGVIVNNHIAR